MACNAGNKTGWLGVVAAASGMLLAFGLVAAEEVREVTLVTSWYAQAEHGGFYQAKAEGIYADHGLDVEIRMGGPQVNSTQLLAAGKVDFATSYSLNILNAVSEGLPILTVGAFFQRDPQSIVVHKGQGVDGLSDLKGKPIKVPAAGRQAYWPWLRAEYGFSDDQLRSYSYDYRAFAEDESLAQQGYITNDGFFLDKVGVEAKSLHLANYGWNAYSATLDVRRDTAEDNPELVRDFLAASIKGWKSYLDNPAPAKELIKAANEEQSDALIAYSNDAMKEYGILTAGAANGGERIGIMTHDRWRSFYQKMVEAGTLDKDLNYEKGFTLEFVKAIYPDAKVGGQ